MQRGVVVLLLVTFTAAACVQYVPVELGVIQRDDEVLVRFTDEGAVRLAREFGRITDALEGNVEPSGPDSMSVSVWLGRDYRGTPFENVHQTVVVGRREVTELRRRQISAWRTTVAAAGAVAVFAFLIDQIFLQEDPNRKDDDGDTPPPPGRRPVIRIPVFRVR